MTVGFIGLGKMGAPIARNIARSGVPLVIWDANLDATKSFASEGAHVAANAAEVAAKSDVLFTSLPGPVEIEAVMFGEEGILKGVREGHAYFDLSTSSYPMVQKVSDAFKERGAFMCDAPVSGGPAGAASGRLAVWIGGDQQVFNDNLELIRSFSDAPLRIGPVGAGTIAKLVHNLSCYVMCDALAETFSLGVKAGVDPLSLYEALYAGMMGRGSILELLNPQFLTGEWNATFALKLGYKDVKLAMDLGKQVGVPMRLASQTLEAMTEALAKGMGELDSRAYMDLQLQRAGVQIAVSPDRVEEARRRILPS